MRFFREWLRLMVAPLASLKGLPVISWLKVIATLLASVGIYVTFAALWHSWQFPVPWWAAVLFISFLCYAAVVAGLAWERSQGPAVEIGPLVLDPQRKGFYVLIRNASVPVKVTVRIVRIVNSKGDPLLDRSWEGYWRGHPHAFDGAMAEHDEAQYGLLRVGEIRTGSKIALYIPSRNYPGTIPLPHVFPVPVVNDVAVEERGVLTVDVVVTCVANSGEKGRPLKVTFQLDPDSGPAGGYKIAASEPATG